MALQFPPLPHSRRPRRRTRPALLLRAALIVAFAASLGLAQEDPAPIGDLSPLSPADCTYALADWQSADASWPAEQVLFAGRMYDRVDLEPLLAIVDDGALRADVALVQQLVVYKLNLLRGATPSSEATDAAAEAEAIFELGAAGLPTGTEEIDAATLDRMTALLPILEAANSANPCADATGE